MQILLGSVAVLAYIMIARIIQEILDRAFPNVKDPNYPKPASGYIDGEFSCTMGGVFWPITILVWGFWYGPKHLNFKFWNWIDSKKKPESFIDPKGGMFR